MQVVIPPKENEDVNLTLSSRRASDKTPQATSEIGHAAKTVILPSEQNLQTAHIVKKAMDAPRWAPDWKRLICPISQ